MTLSHALSTQEKIALISAVAFPPIGILLAHRCGWMSRLSAMVLFFAYSGVITALSASHYFGTLNDLVLVNIPWGLAITLAATPFLFAEPLQVKALLGALFALLMLVLCWVIPYVELACLLQCKSIVIHTLRGHASSLLPGWAAILYLGSMCSVAAIGLAISWARIG